MIGRIRYAIGLAALTGVGIIAAQFYWLYHSYEVKRVSFVRSAREALGFTIFQGIVERDLGMAPGVPFLKEGITKWKGPVMPEDSNKNSMVGGNISIVRNDYAMEIDIVDSLHPPLLPAKGIEIRRIHGADSIRPVRLNIDDNIFRQRLKGNLQQSKIDLPFELFIQSLDTSDQEKHLVVFSRQPGLAPARLLFMDIPGMNYYLFKSMLTELLLSLSVIVVACISFYFLLKIIYQQKRFTEIKNDFISNISHELKTPVSIMMATTDALSQFNGIDDKEKTALYLAINRDELNKLGMTINRILTIDKLGEMGSQLHYSVIDINIFIRNIINRFACFEDLEFHYTSEWTDTGFSTNEDALEIILTNLIDNAYKYNYKMESQVWIECKPSGKGIMIIVKDDGCGIEKKHLPFVFDKFYRVPKGDLHEIKGFGLGLSQVKDLVNQLNGTIELRSQPDRGSEFIINLPAYA